MIRRLSNLGFRWRCRCQRLHRAFAYASGRLSPGEAQTILIECKDYAGWYPLNTLCVEDLLSHAATVQGDNAQLLKPYLHAACEHVSRKWDSGDDLNIAFDLALETAAGYAAQDGVTLEAKEETQHHANPVSKGEDRNA
jgi:hypothetical protein